MQLWNCLGQSHQPPLILERTYQQMNLPFRLPQPLTLYQLLITSPFSSHQELPKGLSLIHPVASQNLAESQHSARFA